MVLGGRRPSGTVSSSPPSGRTQFQCRRSSFWLVFPHGTHSQLTQAGGRKEGPASGRGTPGPSESAGLSSYFGAGGRQSGTAGQGQSPDDTRPGVRGAEHEQRSRSFWRAEARSVTSGSQGPRDSLENRRWKFNTSIKGGTAPSCSGPLTGAAPHFQGAASLAETAVGLPRSGNDRTSAQPSWAGLCPRRDGPAGSHMQVTPLSPQASFPTGPSTVPW